MSNVIDLPVTTTLDIPPDKVLEGAKGKVDEVFVIGWDKDDNLWLSSSSSDMRKVNWLLDCAKHKIFSDVGDL